jgi:dinuclear metal center YbgI/SA1388 family protein
MKLSDAIKILEEIAPLRYAEAWDNVGLLAGDPEQDISSAMLTIDYTPAVAAEAMQKKCDFIIAYHPPIFEGLKRITSGNLVFDAIRSGVAIYSPHTALDVAEGGTNDLLGDILGMRQRQPLRMMETNATQFKLVTFVPEKDLEKVSQALFDAGAGRIGNYSSCSFRSNGTGTFFGEEGTTPAVGVSGKLEHTAEVRVETVVAISTVANVIRALRESHPYEEPAFDLNQLAAPPQGVGQGRIGTLQATSRGEIFQRIKKGLGISHLLVSGPTDGQITRAAVCAGAGGDFLGDALAQKAELYLSGEIRYHDALRAASAGMTVVCTLHSNSERAALKRLAEKLGRQLPRLAVAVSLQDRDPFAVV